MRGELAADSKIAGGAHQPRAEDLLPKPVDRDAGRQRILGPNQPLGQPEPVLGQLSRHGRQHIGRVRLDRALSLVVLAAVEQIGHRRLGALVHDMRDVPRCLMVDSSALKTASLPRSSWEAGRPTLHHQANTPSCSSVDRFSAGVRASPPHGPPQPERRLARREDPS